MIVAERYHVLLRFRAPLRGQCPVCSQPMDAAGCRLEGSADVAPNRYRVKRIVTVDCRGVPTTCPQACPCCAEHPDAPCEGGA